MSTGQFEYGGVPGCCVDPVCGYQILSSYFHVSQVSRQTYIETIQPRPFEEWIEKGNQRDANLCGTCARPTNERSLVRGGGVYNQGSFVYLAKACGGCGGSRCPYRRLGQAQVCARDSPFIAKIEMATRCRGVGREELGVKCGCIQGCCEGARSGVRFWRAMVQVAMSTKTKKVGAAARQS